jgi:hypothetical protein
LYWKAYDATLARIRMHRPQTVDAVAAILGDFQQANQPDPAVGFFPSGGDDYLADALSDAGWTIRYIEGDYLWEALSKATGQDLHYIEGDVYRGPYRPARGE